jgi:hypothetical protein
MAQDINPFEPWRPPEFEQRPQQPNHYETPRPEPYAAEKPWKPAPVVTNPPATNPQVTELLLVVSLFALVILAVVVFFRLPQGHAARIGAAFLPLAVGLCVGIAVARKRRWVVRLGWLAGGVVVAAAAWWFVPTAAGLNLWSAHHLAALQVNELKDLEVGNARGYLKDAAARQSLMAQFPGFKPEIEHAENTWMERSKTHWESAFGKLAAKDVAGWKKLRNSYGPLSSQASFRRLQGQLDQAESRWRARSVEAWVSDLEEVKPENYAAFAAVRASYKEFTNLTLSQAELNWLLRTCRQLKPEDFKGLAVLRNTANPRQQLEPSFQMEQTAWASRSANAVLTRIKPLLKSDPAQASTRLQEAAKPLSDFPAAVALLLPARRQALQARLDVAVRQVGKLATADPAKDWAKEVDEIAVA